MGGDCIQYNTVEDGWQDGKIVSDDNDGTFTIETANGSLVTDWPINSLRLSEEERIEKEKKKEQREVEIQNKERIRQQQIEKEKKILEEKQRNEDRKRQRDLKNKPNVPLLPGCKIRLKALQFWSTFNGDTATIIQYTESNK